MLAFGDQNVGGLQVLVQYAKPVNKLAKIAEKLDTTIEFLLDEGEEISEEEAADARFYRQYRKMDSVTKDKIRQMVKLWGDDA